MECLLATPMMRPRFLAISPAMSKFLVLRLAGFGISAECGQVSLVAVGGHIMSGMQKPPAPKTPAQILDALVGLLGSKAVIGEPGHMGPYLNEPRKRFHVPAVAVALPGSVAQVQAIPALGQCRRCRGDSAGRQYRTGRRPGAIAWR